MRLPKKLERWRMTKSYRRICFTLCHPLWLPKNSDVHLRHLILTNTGDNYITRLPSRQMVKTEKQTKMKRLWIREGLKRKGGKRGVLLVKENLQTQIICSLLVIKTSKLFYDAIGDSSSNEKEAATHCGDLQLTKFSYGCTL